MSGTCVFQYGHRAVTTSRHNGFVRIYPVLKLGIAANDLPQLFQKHTETFQSVKGANGYTFKGVTLQSLGELRIDDQVLKPNQLEFFRHLQHATQRAMTDAEGREDEVDHINIASTTSTASLSTTKAPSTPLRCHEPTQMQILSRMLDMVANKALPGSSIETFLNADLVQSTTKPVPASSAETTTPPRKKRKCIDQNMEYVYAIRERGSDTVKIGRTNDPSRRLRELQVSCAKSLEFEFIISCHNAHILEKSMHEALKSYRLRGEWFLVKDPVLPLLFQPPTK